MTQPDRPATPLVAPLTLERFQVKFTIAADTHQKLRQAQDLLRREIPDGDPGAIFDRALTLLLDDVARKELASTSRARGKAGFSSRRRGGMGVAKRSRHIPADVKREVWLRDEGRCAFVAANGRRCAERAFLEFHHDEPYGIGGEPTVGNISLRCRPHNVHEAELAFGSSGAARRISPRGELNCRDARGSDPGGASPPDPSTRDLTPARLGG